MSDTEKQIVGQIYERALDLYVHEDNLNWTKLHNLLYLNGGLLAIAGFTVDFTDGLMPLSPSDRTIILGIAALGILTSLVFAIALHFGAQYLLARKAAAARLEACLTEEEDHWVVRTRTSHKSALRVSPTLWLLRATPLVFCLAWIGLMVTAIVG
ncbi:MAG: hypothetical protein GX620_07775 [Chloroflexi bacterium]|nr:hypothetical protein [Chloroflexota bacterium]